MLPEGGNWFINKRLKKSEMINSKEYYAENPRISPVQLNRFLGGNFHVPGEGLGVCFQGKVMPFLLDAKPHPSREIPFLQTPPPPRKAQGFPF